MKKTSQTPRYQLRRYLVLAVFVLAVAGLVWRTLDMQVINQAFFQQQGDARHLRVVAVPAHRGDIYDRNGEPLAISTPVDTVWVNPGELIAEQARIPELAQVLSLNAENLRERVQKNSQREFLYVRRHIEPALGEQVRALALPGVYLRREYRRYYPAGEVTAHVLGMTNVDDHGQEGIELA
jgi:cell division protein FtsI (penicillin-binding protein 3)